MAIYRSSNRCSRRSRFISRARDRLVRFDRMAIRNLFYGKPAKAATFKILREEEMVEVHELPVPTEYTAAHSLLKPSDPSLLLKKARRQIHDICLQLIELGNDFTNLGALTSDPDDVPLSPTLTWPQCQTPSPLDSPSSTSGSPRRKSFTSAETERVNIWLRCVSAEGGPQVHQQEEQGQQQQGYINGDANTNNEENGKEKNQQQINSGTSNHGENANKRVHFDNLPALIKEIRKRQKSDSTCSSSTYYSSNWEEAPVPQSLSAASKAGLVLKSSDFPALPATAPAMVNAVLQHMLDRKLPSDWEKEKDRKRELEGLHRGNNNDDGISTFESRDAQTQTQTQNETGTEPQSDNDDECSLKDWINCGGRSTTTTLACCSTEDFHWHCERRNLRAWDTCDVYAADDEASPASSYAASTATSPVNSPATTPATSPMTSHEASPATSSAAFPGTSLVNSPTIPPLAIATDSGIKPASSSEETNGNENENEHKTGLGIGVSLFLWRVADFILYAIAVFVVLHFLYVVRTHS